MKFKFLYVLIPFVLVSFTPIMTNSDSRDRNMDQFLWVYGHIAKSNPSLLDPEEVSNYILDASNRLLNGNYKLSTCIMKTESHFNNIKKGDSNSSYGVGQMHREAMVDSCIYLGLRNCNQKYLIRKMQKDILFSIELSIGYMSILQKHYGVHNISKILASYNSGVYNTDHSRYSRAYVKKVYSCIKH